MSNLLTRRRTRFVLWCPSAPANPPELVIGQIQNGNPPTFNQLAQRPLQKALDAGTPIDGLWELDPTSLGLADGRTYHYWFEVDDTSPGGSGRIQVTDPLASTVDYRLFAPANRSLSFPASVIGFSGGKLVTRDPNGEQGNPTVAPFTRLTANSQTVIYELPTAWSSSTGSDGFERAVGTFRDVRALTEPGVLDLNFSELGVTKLDPPYLVQLGVNALEMLPPADSIYSRQWGYGTSHYFAPDYELGYPEGFLSPTADSDLVDLINSLHSRGIRVLLDVVLGFMKEEPYRYIDFDDFYLEDPPTHAGDPDAASSRFDRDGNKELRNPFGASCPRYVKTRTTYDPITGVVKQISPARQHMLTFLTRWMQDFMIDGIRMDSVENVANWDFVEEFKSTGHDLFAARYPGEAADDSYIVVGEELQLPLALLSQHRLDSLWNEQFQTFIRAALAGQNAANEQSFERTVRRAIDCKMDHLNGTQAVNYLTSHDVEGFRKERLYTQMASDVLLTPSEALFDRGQIEAEVLASIKAEGRDPGSDEVRDRASELILHKGRLRRIRLGFVCLLTAVGIPMILAGEEFGDDHDLFDRHGRVTHHGGKQVDPVNYSRFDEPDRNELFIYVAKLIRLRTSHPSLAADEVFFFHTDFEDGKRVVVWRRGPASDPVVVVANFSDYTTPNALSPGAEYVVPHWPDTPSGEHWFEMTQDRHIRTGQHDRESIFAWEAKVYHLAPGDNF